MAAMNDAEKTPDPDDSGPQAVPEAFGTDVIPLDRERITTRLRRDRRRAVWPLIGLGCFLLIQIGLLCSSDGGRIPIPARLVPQTETGTAFGDG